MKKYYFYLILLLMISTEVFASDVQGMIRNAISSFVKIGGSLGILAIAISGIAFKLQMKNAIEMLKASVTGLIIVLGSGAFGKFIENIVK